MSTLPGAQPEPLAYNPTTTTATSTGTSSVPSSLLAGASPPPLPPVLSPLRSPARAADLPPLPLPPQSNDGDDDEGDPSLAFFRHTPIPTLILDPSLRICQVSDSFLNVSSGCGRDYVLGNHLDCIFDQKLKRTLLPSARRIIRAVQDTNHPFKLPTEQSDGKAWTLRAVPIYRHGQLQYIQMELTDTTEEHQKQLELEEKLQASEIFRTLVQSVKDYAIFLLDKDGNVATWNAGAQKFKGYTKDEIVGRHFSNFYSQEDRDNEKPARELRDALRDGRCEDEGWRYRKDGSKFWANVVITPIYRDDALLGFAKVTRDLSERRKAEADLIAAYEESSKLKSEFLANMSHEIRTPMHGMLAATTLLLDTPLNPDQLELTRVIEESGEVLVQVINDILDYSKLAQGGFSISHDIISVADIIQSVYRVHTKSCRQELSLEIHLDPKLPAAAEGDSLRYRQIVQNLMSNATKFTEDGYVRVEAMLQKEDHESYTILTEVTDTGVGIPSEVSGSLFKPFTQFDNSATKRYKGTGLGLSICKSLSGLMLGEIGYHPNKEGRGSVFWFTVRLKKVQQWKVVEALQQKLENQDVAAHSTPIEAMRPVAVNKRVLLTEDNPINQKVMLKMLQGLGFEKIDLASDGRQAVDMVMKDPPPYDVILMDINMPILDGVSATKEIRKAGLVVPIIAMTANALKGQPESYLAKGMTAYVSKPVDRKLLVNLLLRCLQDTGPD